MKKRIISFILTVLMVVAMIPAASFTVLAAKLTANGVSVESSGLKYNDDIKSYYLDNMSEKLLYTDGSSIYSSFVSQIFTDAECRTDLKKDPIIGETYYFNMLFKMYSDTAYSVTDANSTIEVTGFCDCQVVDAHEYGSYYVVVCSITYGELTGGVKAVASGVEYDSELGGYAPTFTTLKAVSTEGKELDQVNVPSSSGGYSYSYYGAYAKGLYKTYSNGRVSDKLTTDFVEGETYYSYINLNSIDGNLHIEDELVDISIDGYRVRFLGAYESDGGFTSQIFYSITKTPAITVNGVEMYDGNYLANGATKTTTTKPSGGYAYYKNGVLTLDNYKYEGDRGISLYSSLGINLIGENTLVNTGKSDDIRLYLTITVMLTNSELVIEGPGSLNCIGGISASGDIIINNTNVTVDGNGGASFGLRSYMGDVIVKGGRLTAIGGGSAIQVPNGDFLVTNDMKIKASTTNDGALGEYVAANHDSYKKIVVTPAPIFDDVFETSWFKGAVDYVVGRGLMNGTSETKFEPNTPMSRAMLVTVLWRLEGSPAISGSNPFTDLKQAWYKDAVNWAYQNSIVNGTDADKFSPNGNITREQMAAILYRYSEYKGKDVSARADISAYPDASKVHSYAADAISWANAEGLITGSKEGNQTVLAPRASATRAQVATILMRYCNK